MIKITDPNNEGQEIEVYTEAEVKEREQSTRTAVEGEYKPKLEELSGKLTDAEARAKERAGEFAQFRKLSDDALAKLSVAERTIYENGLALQQEREKSAKQAQDAHKTAVAAVIKEKAKGDEKLITKMTEMWSIIGLADTTPEEREQKALAVIGAIGTTTPDLLASLGDLGGVFTPPKPKNSGESFADTDAGKSLGKDLGLTLEPPRKQ